MLCAFSVSYSGSEETFNAYRREIEGLLQWSWFIKEQSVLTYRRDDMAAFIQFCMKSYKRWIGLKNVARFKPIDGTMQPNPEWRPFYGECH